MRTVKLAVLALLLRAGWPSASLAQPLFSPLQDPVNGERVFNDKGPVREETRQRVLRVARRLRYAPHGAARSLITRRTSTIAR